MPAIELHSNKLLDMFKKNLTKDFNSDEAPPSSQEDAMDVDIELEDHNAILNDAEVPCKCTTYLFSRVIQSCLQ